MVNRAVFRLEYDKFDKYVRVFSRYTPRGNRGRSIDLLPSFLSDDRTNSDYRPATERLFDVSIHRNLVWGVRTAG